MDLKNIVESNTLDRYSFGAFLRERREELGLSVRELAKNLGISAVYLSDIERGNRNAPSNDDLLNKLMKYLDIPESEKEYFTDLAAATRDFVFPDINLYLGREYKARYAMRYARDLNMDDKFWTQIIEELSRREEEMASKQKEAEQNER